MMRVKYLFILGLSFSLLTVQAQAAPVKVRVAIGQSKLPYVSEETKSGVEYELIFEPLKRAGYTVEIQHLANKRAQILFKDGKVDVAIDNEGAILSEPYIAYHNMAITFCDRKIEIKNVSDLEKYKVGAFHNANKYLGVEFAKLAKNKEKYEERQPQDSLNSALMKNVFDVVVSDINIFKYNQLEFDPNFQREICAFDVFGPTLYRLTFKEAQVRDKYNSELKKLRDTNFYEDLAKKYKLTNRRKKPYFKP